MLVIILIYFPVNHFYSLCILHKNNKRVGIFGDNSEDPAVFLKLPMLN